MERTILLNLIENEPYARKVIPYLKTEYFANPAERVLFELIASYFHKYNELPTRETLASDLDERDDVVEQTFLSIQDFLENETYEEQNLEWLVDRTEKFCQDRAILNGIRRSIRIIDRKEKNASRGQIPEILKEALSVSFDERIGHDFVEEWEHRLDYYQRTEDKIEFDIELLNKITAGGVSRKTLNILLAPTGVGKTMMMCHMAAYNLVCGLNVLYVTMEMSEEEIGKRIDANLLDVPISELRGISRERYLERINRLRSRVKGRLIVKEYPTAGASTAHFSNLIRELRIKKNFAPDVIYVDYLNICASSRITPNSSSGTYAYSKSIAEELRGLAVESNAALITATQSNRDAYGSSDLSLQNTSDSIGVPFTADLMLAIIATEELTELNQILLKQLKNRYGDMNYYTRFVVGVDRTKMRLYDVEREAQGDVMGNESSLARDYDGPTGNRFGGFV